MSIDPNKAYGSEEIFKVCVNNPGVVFEDPHTGTELCCFQGTFWLSIRKAGESNWVKVLGLSKGSYKLQVKQYTAKEALHLAIDNPGKVFINRYGSECWVSDNNTLHWRGFNRSQDQAASGAFETGCEPYTEKL